MNVELSLVAKDLAGQTGRSAPVELVLPERQFSKPLARAVVEQRRRLAEDPRDRPQVARALAALTLEPEGFIEDLQVFLGLRSAYWRLQRDGTRAGRNSVIAQLWNIALRIEDGNLTDAERNLRAAQERLQKALEQGASDEEIQKLMQELRQALAQFLEQLSKQAQNQPPMQGQDRNNQFLNQQDLEQMLRNLENMARSGNRDMAQQMLSQLRDLLDRLQSGRMADQGQNQRFGQMIDEFGDIIGRQQQLLDDTFGQQRQQQGQPGTTRPARAAGSARPAGTTRPARPTGSARPARPAGRWARRGRPGGRARRPAAPAARHAAAAERGLREFGLQAPGQLNGAGEAMERAERALRDGDLDGATQEETRALEQLRQGAREMAQQMLRQMPSRFGLNDPDGELDPMGRLAAAHRWPRSGRRREGPRPDRHPACPRDPGGAAPAPGRADQAVPGAGVPGASAQTL